MSLMEDRKIIRIAVSPRAKEIVEWWAEQQDMSELGVASRIYQWFADQPEPFQRQVLGLLGGCSEDVAIAYLRKVAKQAADAEKAVLDGAANAQARKPRRRG